MIINEAYTDSPLYHTTTGSNAISILTNNVLSSNGHNSGLNSRSFTRDKSLALKGTYGSVTFVINQSLLNSNYKITPRSDTYKFLGKPKARYTGSSKSEEIVTGDIINFSRYIIKILINTKLGKIKQRDIDTIQNLAKSKSIPVEIIS